MLHFNRPLRNFSNPRTKSCYSVYLIHSSSSQHIHGNCMCAYVIIKRYWGCQKSLKNDTNRSLSLVHCWPWVCHPSMMCAPHGCIPCQNRLCVRVALGALGPERWVKNDPLRKSQNGLVRWTLDHTSWAHRSDVVTQRSKRNSGCESVERSCGEPKRANMALFDTKNQHGQGASQCDFRGHRVINLCSIGWLYGNSMGEVLGATVAENMKCHLFCAQ